MTAAEQLADARHKLGLSLDDISTRTKVSVDRLRAIEELDLEGLPSLVYLKGFVRAYAAEVGLHADTISDLYISELPDSVSHLSSGVYIMPTTEESFAAFESEAVGDDAVVTERGLRGVVTPPEDLQLHAPEPGLLPAHAPTVVGATGAALTQPSSDRTSLRIAALAVATVFAGLAGFLLSANIGGREAGRRVDSASAPAAGLSRGSADANATTQLPEHEPRMPRGATGAPAQRELRATRQSPVAQNQTAVALPNNTRNLGNKTDASERAIAKRGSEPARGESAPADVSVPSAVILVPGSAETHGATATAVETADAADDVSGAWSVTSHVETATVDAYKDLMLGFRLELEQRGNRVEGTGYKISENGAALPAPRRTPINVEGTLDGTRLTLDFTEQGTRRASKGRFLLYLSDDGSFRGRFKSDAAQSSGVTVAVRESSARD